MTAARGPDTGASDAGVAGVRQPIFETGPRLALCALLQGADWVEFATVRDLIGVSDSAVSKHSRTLEDAGHLEIRKGSVGRRPRTWLRLTSSGRTALSAHLTWLTELRHAIDEPQ
ncbi:Winged helix DNA-binding domain-containing protein [Pseudonocardia ammonioxydans]|uniref:Winged helix DNA-binding domain-containing protein n=1 Tax=Pseudonocardia ammonioxydans TaxID=260086 RepID=A0A1I5G4Y9_PSUAM|nr:transcriptional regulator [Pseudonocardia ammonioxydans]SFO31052.1 Winged helix DNA-binding domain-containing protein [Pseudonocardia ammonioxydans]